MSLRPIKKLLIANRGEIALRIAQTCQKLSIPHYTISTTPEFLAPYTLKAHKNFIIGTGPSKDSFLNIQKIIKICVTNGIDAVHPGYGFLSENLEFVS